MSTPWRERHAQGFSHLRQALGELEAVAGLVAGQLQAADEFAAHVGQRLDTTHESLGQAVKALISGLEWPLQVQKVPSGA